MSRFTIDQDKIWMNTIEHFRANGRSFVRNGWELPVGWYERAFLGGTRVLIEVTDSKLRTRLNKTYNHYKKQKHNNKWELTRRGK